MLKHGAEVAQNFTSPLAQIFQPLVIDEDIPEETESLGIPTGISYGPASRRRQSLMQRSPAAESATQLAHRFPTMMGDQAIGEEGQLSTSPAPDSARQEPETAGQVEDSGSETGGINQWNRRLQKLEQGQKRIEDLLLQISKNQQGQ